MLIDPVFTMQEQEINDMIQRRIEESRPVVQPQLDEANMKRIHNEDLFISLLEHILLEFSAKTSNVDPSRYVQV